MRTILPPHPAAAVEAGWREWLVTGAALLARDGLAVASAIATWHERMRQRRHLGALDQRLLADLGLSRADVMAETAKPFWRP